jgi:predicted PurR-regulated permease PerM
MIPTWLKKPRLQIFIAVAALVLFLFWQARGALTPFIIGLVVAYLILPIVNLFEWLFRQLFQRLRPKMQDPNRIARPLAVLSANLLIIMLLMGFIFTIVPPISAQVRSLIENADDLYLQGSELVNDGLAQYQQIPPEIRQQIEAELAKFNPQSIINPIVTTVGGALATITNTITFVLSLVVIPFWLFFVLNDDSSVLNGTIDIIPHDLRPDIEAIRIILDRILSAYIRGQLIVASLLGIVVTVGLTFLGVQYALLLGLLAALFAFIPVAGAILGAIPAVVVAFIQEPQLALYVIILITVYQQIDNAFISPRIMGEAVALHPALIMVVVVVGSSLLGAIGALVAVPAAAMLRDVAQYFYIRAGENSPGPEAALRLVGYRATPRLEVMEAQMLPPQMVPGD